jgi:16S rRNA G966 N2-methylase RsmD
MTMRFEVVAAEALDFLRRRAKEQAKRFDIIFFDPPYTTNYEVALDFVGEQRRNAFGRTAV